MICNNERRIAQLMSGTSQTPNRLIGLEQQLGRNSANGQNDLWFNELNLALQVASTGR
jgi:hypothetical protein